MIAHLFAVSWFLQHARGLRVLPVASLQTSYTTPTTFQNQVFSSANWTSGTFIHATASLTVELCTFKNIVWTDSGPFIDVENASMALFYSCTFDSFSGGNPGDRIIQVTAVQWVELVGTVAKNFSIELFRVMDGMKDNNVIVHDLKVSNSNREGEGAQIMSINPSNFWISACEFTDCRTHYLLQFGTGTNFNSRVECHDSKFVRISHPSDSGKLELLNEPPGQDQVFTNCFMEDCPISIWSTSTYYFMNCHFKTTQSGKTALKTLQSDMLLSGCTFDNFEIGLTAENGGQRLQVCNTTFTSCMNPIDRIVTLCELINCRFLNVTGNISVRAYSQQVLRIISCYFSFEIPENRSGLVAGPAIQVAITDSVFFGVGARLSIALDPSGGVQFNITGCCFSETQERALGEFLDSISASFSNSNCDASYSSRTEQDFCQSAGAFPPTPSPVRTAPLQPQQQPRSRTKSLPPPSKSGSPPPIITQSANPSVTVTPMPPVSRTPADTLTQTPTATPFATVSAAFERTAAFTASPSFTASASFAASRSFPASSSFPADTAFPPSSAFSASHEFPASAPLTPSAPPPASEYFPPSQGFSPSSALPASVPFMSSSADFTATPHFGQSASFGPTSALAASGLFTASSVFKASSFFTGSSICWVSEQFTVSETFAPTDQGEPHDSREVRESDKWVGTGQFTASQVSTDGGGEMGYGQEGGLSPALGTSLSVLAVLSALVLLLLLKKRSKKQKTTTQPPSEGEQTFELESDLETLGGGGDEFISEYGLSEVTELNVLEGDLDPESLQSEDVSEENLYVSENNPELEPSLEFGENEDEVI